MAEARLEQVRTRIWREESEPADRFATRAAWCRGYDVYGDMLGRARWVDMLWLLFREEAATDAQARLLEALAVALANAGPRDAAVHAAMCSGLGRSPAAAALMAALAVGAGRHGGAQEVAAAMSLWADMPPTDDVPSWAARWLSAAAPTSAIWSETDHPPGFEPNGVVSAGIVRAALQRLAEIGDGPRLRWLAERRGDIEAAVKLPLAMSGVAAAALCDLGFGPEQGEMLHLLLRLPGAAAHALEQRAGSYKDFPFFALDLQDDPLKEAA
ncbi:citryl-CoA lyase [Roseateles asaccharophilus]|uniref:Citrate synthase n=1 Tax=Roseateles asaccharophilus TaxID=582607 RepID=A0ABU2AA89_9BURK|nr:citryl-CoA lyase [Roseateles asaccharophilus]MDR7334124.1 citrate synthase [Roseateles asaccharophilus]